MNKDNMYQTTLEEKIFISPLQIGRSRKNSKKYHFEFGKGTGVKNLLENITKMYNETKENKDSPIFELDIIYKELPYPKKQIILTDNYPFTYVEMIKFHDIKNKLSISLIKVLNELGFKEVIKQVQGKP